MLCETLEKTQDFPKSIDELRYNWTVSEIQNLLEKPLMDLVYQAQTVHRLYHPENTIQLASLFSIKTGLCPEDCKYCPQSAHWAKKTQLPKQDLVDVDVVLEKAQQAKQAGATRFCMGAAWRKVQDGQQFDSVLDMVKGVKDLGLEPCVTLGMLTKSQADRLADAGLVAYNHNLDTSPEFYDEIISTRTYQDRLDTLQNVRSAGLTVCSGGIIGMGETLTDRASMLQVLSSMNPHPESVPINSLVAVQGTPLENQKAVDSFELVRMVAVARIIMPKTRVRLSAGREKLSQEAQVLCFLAGANSIFYGEKLLTTANNDVKDDIEMIEKAGFKVEQVA